MVVERQTREKKREEKTMKREKTAESLEAVTHTYTHNIFTELVNSLESFNLKNKI